MYWSALIALLLTMPYIVSAISYRCDGNRVLIVQSFGNNTIRMHCQKLSICANKNLKCNYEENQSHCGGKDNFVAHVEQSSPVGPVNHRCCHVVDETGTTDPSHYGNECFVYELPDGMSNRNYSFDSDVNVTEIKSLSGESLLPEGQDNYDGYRLRLFLLKNKSKAKLLVKAIERRESGFRVTICHPQCKLQLEASSKGCDQGLRCLLSRKRVGSDWFVAAWSAWSSSKFNRWSKTDWNPLNEPQNVRVRGGNVQSFGKSIPVLNSGSANVFHGTTAEITGKHSDAQNNQQTISADQQNITVKIIETNNNKNSEHLTTDNKQINLVEEITADNNNNNNNNVINGGRNGTGKLRNTQQATNNNGLATNITVSRYTTGIDEYNRNDGTKVTVAANDREKFVSINDGNGEKRGDITVNIITNKYGGGNTATENWNIHNNRLVSAKFSQTGKVTDDKLSSSGESVGQSTTTKISEKCRTIQKDCDTNEEDTKKGQQSTAHDGSYAGEVTAVPQREKFTYINATVTPKSEVSPSTTTTASAATEYNSTGQRSSGSVTVTPTSTTAIAENSSISLNPSATSTTATVIIESEPEKTTKLLEKDENGNLTANIKNRNDSHSDGLENKSGKESNITVGNNKKPFNDKVVGAGDTATNGRYKTLHDGGDGTGSAGNVGGKTGGNENGKKDAVTEVKKAGSSGSSSSGGGATSASAYAAGNARATPGSQSRQAGGNCFSGNSKVKTPFGEVLMSDLKVGDMVLVPAAQNLLKYETVEMFYHREPDTAAKFLILHTQSGKTLSLTELHLLPVGNCAELSNNLKNVENIDEVMRGSIFAYKAQKGDCVLTVTDDGQLQIDKIIKIGRKYSKGIYAPITAEGSIIADGVLASCFSQLESHFLHKLAHDFYILLYYAFGSMMNSIYEPIQHLPVYIDTLHHISRYVLPFAKY